MIFSGSVIFTVPVAGRSSELRVDRQPVLVLDMRVLIIELDGLVEIGVGVIPRRNLARHVAADCAGVQGEAVERRSAAAAGAEERGRRVF